jgi:short-subunit dehydrogenase
MPTTIVEDFVTTLDVMFWGMLYPTLAVCPRYGQTRWVRGDISIGGMVNVPHLLSYSCARFATVGLSASLRAEPGVESSMTQYVLYAPL